MTELNIAHPAGRLSCWFKGRHVNPLLKEINLIWRQADIEWFVESVVEHEPATTDTSAARYVVNAKRDDHGRGDPDRIPRIYSYFNVDKHYPVIQNLYFFPFVGNTSQGFAGDPDDRVNRVSNHAAVGIWSNEYSNGGGPYRTPVGDRARADIPETSPQKRNFFQKGSLGRNCAHELCHHLRLAHPDEEKQAAFQRLMGGKRPAYSLTPNEITTARAEAMRRAKSCLSWDPESIIIQIKGHYRRSPVEEDWHQGEISGQDESGTYLWKNKAGKSWRLSLDPERLVLGTDTDNPDFNTNKTNGREFRLVLKRHSKSGHSEYRVKGFRFKTDYLERRTNGN